MYPTPKNGTAKSVPRPLPPLRPLDIIFGGINGAIFGVLFPIILRSNDSSYVPGTIESFLFFTILSCAGIAVGYVLGLYVRTFFYQLAKFGLIGVTNTAVDFGVSNLVFLIAGSSTGIFFPIGKSFGFISAVVNSYFWNKYWTFEQKKSDNINKEFTKFFLISVSGFLINVTIGWTVNFLGPFGTLTEDQWANVAIAVASISTLTWNFLGYKLFVFKK